MAHWPYRTLSEQLSKAVRLTMFESGPDAVSRVLGALSAIWPMTAPPLPDEDAQASLERIGQLVAVAPGESLDDRARRLTPQELNELKTALLRVLAFIAQDYGRDGTG